MERNDRRTTWEAGPSDTSLSLTKSVSRGTGSTRPRPHDFAPPPQFPVLTARNPQRYHILPASQVGTRESGGGGGDGELPTRSAFSHPHEVNFFNIGRRAGRRGPGDRGPARGPGWRAGSGRDLAWVATDGLCPRDRPSGWPGCGPGFSDPLGRGEELAGRPYSAQSGTRNSGKLQPG